jgi:hypothetical protein
VYLGHGDRCFRRGVPLVGTSSACATGRSVSIGCCGTPLPLSVTAPPPPPSHHIHDDMCVYIYIYLGGYMIYDGMCVYIGGRI